MKRTSRLLIAALAVVALPVLAQTSTPKVDQRQANQQQRIDQGVASGQLTGKEAARLDKGQAQVEKKEAKADGKVTANERQKLQHAQNQQSKKIRHEKHDRQRDLDHDGKKDAPAAKK